MGISHQGRLLPSFAKKPAWLKRVESDKITSEKADTLPYSPPATVLLGKSTSTPSSGPKGLQFACQPQTLFSVGFSICWSVAFGTTIPFLEGIDIAFAELQILTMKNMMEKDICHTLKCAPHYHMI